jgi:hypothetical protein
MRLRLITLGLALACGCNAVARSNARDELMQSKRAYMDCLKKNNNVTQCTGLKEAYDVDLQTYRAVYAKRGYEVPTQ